MDKAIRHLKGVFAPLDMLDDGNIVREEHCFTLQDYSYECHRTRNEEGRPYGRIVNTVLSFTIRLPHLQENLPFYRQMKDHEPLTFSFIFNANFDDLRQLSSYDDAMTVRGYVVDIIDSFGSKASLSATTAQVSVGVKMLLTAINYVGTNYNQQLLITN